MISRSIEEEPVQYSKPFLGMGDRHVGASHSKWQRGGAPAGNRTKDNYLRNKISANGLEERNTAVIYFDKSDDFTEFDYKRRFNM